MLFRLGLGLLAELGLASLLIAQEAVEPSPVTSIVTLVVQLGLSGVFLWQWLRADTRATEAGEKMLALAERMLPTLAQATETLERVQQGMERQIERAAPDRELDTTLRRFESAVDEFTRTVRRRSEDTNARDDLR